MQDTLGFVSAVEIQNELLIGSQLKFINSTSGY